MPVAVHLLLGLRAGHTPHHSMLEGAIFIPGSSMSFSTWRVLGGYATFQRLLHENFLWGKMGTFEAHRHRLSGITVAQKEIIPKMTSNQMLQ